MRNFYANTNDRALDINRIGQLAPSVLADRPYSGVSGRYSFISSLEIVKSLMQAGWEVTRVQEQRARIADKKGFTKHMVRFRQAGAVTADGLKVGGLLPEVVMFNDHSGAGSYQFMGGIFRIVCSNGLIVADATIGEFRVAHRGDILNEVHTAVQQISARTPELVDRVMEMRARNLSDKERELYATVVAIDRWGDELPFHPRRLLAPRRYQDAGTDLFTTMNVVQENMVRGGVRFITPAHTTIDDAGNSVYVPTARKTSRRIGSVTTDKQVNESTWKHAKEILDGMIDF